MPPAAIMFRVLLFFIGVALVTIAVLKIISYFTSIDRVAKTKAQAMHAESKASAEATEQDILKKSYDKIRKMKE